MVFRSLNKSRKSACVFFTTVCNSSITNTTSKPSHDYLSIIPLSNHQTKIMLKSHNLRNIIYMCRGETSLCASLVGAETVVVVERLRESTFKIKRAYQTRVQTSRRLITPSTTPEKAKPPRLGTVPREKLPQVLGHNYRPPNGT